MATWPSSLPDKVLSQGYSETPADTTIRSEVGNGPAKVRGLISRGVREISCAVGPLTSAQVDTLDSFYRTDCDSGAAPFTWVHPRTGATLTDKLRFTGPPTYSPYPDSASYYTATMKLEILP